jgi:hypothetical protein
VGCQRNAPAALPPGKTRYPLYRRPGGPQGRSGRGRKISPPTRFDPRTVQPVALRYTDCAIPAHNRAKGRRLRAVLFKLPIPHPGSSFSLDPIESIWVARLCKTRRNEASHDIGATETHPLCFVRWDTSLGGVVVKMPMCQCWLLWCLMCIICYPCVMCTSDSE